MAFETVGKRVDAKVVAVAAAQEVWRKDRRLIVACPAVLILLVPWLDGGDDDDGDESADAMVEDNTIPIQAATMEILERIDFVEVTMISVGWFYQYTRVG